MIDRETAESLARQEVERNGLPWTLPISVHWGIWNFKVWTRADSRGANIIIRVNRRSGTATIVAMTPR